MLHSHTVNPFSQSSISKTFDLFCSVLSKQLSNFYLVYQLSNFYLIAHCHVQLQNNNNNNHNNNNSYPQGMGPCCKYSCHHVEHGIISLNHPLTILYCTPTQSKATSHTFSSILLLSMSQVLCLLHCANSPFCSLGCFAAQAVLSPGPGHFPGVSERGWEQRLRRTGIASQHIYQVFRFPGLWRLLSFLRN